MESGAGTGLIDGVSLGLNRKQWGEISGFFGTLGADRLFTTHTFWSLDKTTESRSAGGRLRADPVLGSFAPDVSFCFASVDRTPHENLVTDAERIGIDGELRMAPGDSVGRVLAGARLYGSWRQDLIYGKTLSAVGGLELTGGPRDLWGWVEYDRTRPDFMATDFFASFESDPVDQVRAGVGCDVYHRIRASVDGDVLTFSGDQNEQGARLLLSYQGFAAGYQLHSGYGGDLAGLILSGHRDLCDRVTLDATVGHTQYKYGEGEPQTDDNETSGIIAVGYRILPTLTLTGQVEGLHNVAFDHDVRFLGIVHWRFRTVL